jgi:hypothetical protein
MTQRLNLVVFGSDFSALAQTERARERSAVQACQCGTTEWSSGAVADNTNNGLIMHIL